jgi:ABC-type uncharacterized transport system permease subunit
MANSPQLRQSSAGFSQDIKSFFNLYSQLVLKPLLQARNLRHNSEVMIQDLLASLLIFIYLLLCVMLVYRLVSAGRGLRKQTLLGMALFAVVIHGYLLHTRLFVPANMDLSIYTVFSVVTWVITALLVVFAWREPVENLLIGVLPFAIAAVFLRLISRQHYVLTEQLSSGLELHILVSIIAYSLLSIAALQAILLYIQDTFLHNQHPAGFVRALPPLETMERLLFRMIATGFIVLSVSVVSGFVYLEDVFAQHLAHKVILSVGAWILYAILLWGRWRFGWRGRIAIRWTLTGFVLLLLAYFGSKFVIEVILHR